MSACACGCWCRRGCVVVGVGVVCGRVVACVCVGVGAAFFRLSFQFFVFCLSLVFFFVKTKLTNSAGGFGKLTFKTF